MDAHDPAVSWGLHLRAEPPCPGGFEYNGGSLPGLFAQRRNLLSPGFWKLLREIVRFNKRALKSRYQPSDRTVGEWLERYGFDGPMVARYLLPMAGAIWSASPKRILDFPVQSLFHFMDNHGLQRSMDSVQWCSLRGGSQTYVKSLVASCTARIPHSSARRSVDEVHRTTLKS